MCFKYASTLALNLNKINKTLKEYQELNLLLIITTGIALTLHPQGKIGIDLR